MPDKEPVYRFSDGVVESDYEGGEAEEAHFKPEDSLGEGAYSMARYLVNLAKRDQRKVVLKPKNSPAEVDEREVAAKQAFFAALWGEQQVKLFRKENGDYRLVTPLIEGSPYHKLVPTLTTPEQEIALFISGVDALQRAHQAGRVVLDLKGDNILADDKLVSHLVDGGSSVKIGQLISSDVFCCADDTERRTKQAHYYHAAPELWHLKSNNVFGDPSMDVWSFGRMMTDLSAYNTPALVELARTCQDLTPESRPKLPMIKTALETILSNMAEARKTITGAKQAISDLAIDFSAQSTSEMVHTHQQHLLQNAQKLAESPALAAAYQVLGMRTAPDDLVQIIDDQKKKIAAFARIRAMAIQISDKIIDFNGKNTVEEAKKHHDVLSADIAMFENHAILKEACADLGLINPPTFFTAALQAKQEEIRGVFEAQKNCISVAQTRLVPIDHALNTLTQEIGQASQHQITRACQEAAELLTTLKTQRNIYFTGLCSAKSAADYLTLDATFKTTCSQAIHRAKLTLAEDIDWISFLTNMLKALVNGGVTVVTLGFSPNFFASTKASSLVHVETAAQQLVNPV